MKNTREFLTLVHGTPTKALARMCRNLVADSFNQPREVLIAAWVKDRDDYRRECLADYLAERAARRLPKPDDGQASMGF